MDSLRGMGLTIGEYAEKLMKGGAIEPSRGSTAPSPRQPVGPIYEQKDISHIEVPDSFMKQVLGKKYVPTQTPNKVVKQKIQEQRTQQSAQLLNEEKVDELLMLLRDVRGLLIEMTTAGAMGANLAGPVNKKSKIFRRVLRKT